MSMPRERLASRLGFLLLSAGCAIGLGNVWRFPYITGQYGGALFVLVYLFFLLVMGLPILTLEVSSGGRVLPDDVLYSRGGLDAFLLLVHGVRRADVPDAAGCGRIF